MNGYRATLAENATTGNGASEEWPGGQGYFMAEGTWGGGSAKLQFSTPRGTWVDIAGGSLTANGTLKLDIPPGQIRTVIATASAVYAYCVRV